MPLRIRVRSRGSGPTRRPPPGERPGSFIVDPGRATPPLPVYVLRSVLESMHRYARSGGEFEVGGFLLGGYHYHEGHSYLDITAEVPCLKARSARTHLTFSNEAQREFHRVAQERHPDKRVLGWYHTHPGYGVFLSDYDLFVQRSFFAEEHLVAVVIDPLEPPSQRTGVFVWHRGDVSHGYHLIVYDQEVP
ncbi:MAG: hypothetical protein D6731_03845 [Planctomycetota bacterium]|nr:MAG: hypothetical protein D6731_03845 [Planctomycetota bacterium]